MNPFYLALIIYFFFYLINHSGPVGDYLKDLLKYLPEKVQYAVTCIFCASFWTSLLLVPLLSYSFWWILVIPVINLFVNSLYLSLTQ